MFSTATLGEKGWRVDTHPHVGSLRPGFLKHLPEFLFEILLALGHLFDRLVVAVPDDRRVDHEAAEARCVNIDYHSAAAKVGASHGTHKTAKMVIRLKSWKNAIIWYGSEVTDSPDREECPTSRGILGRDSALTEADGAHDRDSLLDRSKLQTSWGSALVSRNMCDGRGTETHAG